jgi:AraC-like DNA-binding protein
MSQMLNRSSETLRPDPLGEVLQDLRLSGVSYGRCELSEPWGIAFPAQHAARFHCLLEGGCWLQMAEPGVVRFDAGDVVLVPHGAKHALKGTAEAPATSIDDMPLEAIGREVYRLRAGGGGARSTLVCCSVEFEEPSVHPLLELMPLALLVRGGARDDPGLATILGLMAEEVTAPRLAAATVLTRLADVVIARVIRAWADGRSGDTTGWLAAIRDRKIGRALVAIHRQPDHDWSVKEMAEVAVMSRSMFSARFAALVGMSPARYLARWRMHLAGQWLRRERLTVAEAAARLGYESDASFSRAFKRLTGMPPSALRRSA